MTCRFIEEYANFKIKTIERQSKTELYGISKEKAEKAIQGIENTVKATRKGLITVDECMLNIARCFDF